MRVKSILRYLRQPYHDEDRRRGVFNALAASYPPERVGAEARRLFREAHRQIEPLLDRLDLPRGALARQLLVWFFNLDQ